MISKKRQIEDVGEVEILEIQDHDEFVSWVKSNRPAMTNRVKESQARKIKAALEDIPKGAELIEPFLFPDNRLGICWLGEQTATVVLFKEET